MSFGRHLEGVILLCVALIPVAAGSVALRRRLLPAWSGPPALLAEIVLGVTQVLVVSEALGAVSLFEPVPVALGCALTGGALWLLRASPGAPGEAGAERPDAPPVGPAVLCAALACALVVGQWAVGTVGTLREGPTGPDTLGYHGPVAARFVQDGEVFQLLFLSFDSSITFLPFNAELLHAVGMLWMGSDVLLPFLNLAFLAVALLAAWCIGRPWGVGPAALIGAAIVLGAPSIAISQGGSADNDVTAACFLLAAVAVLLNGGLRTPVVAVAGLAAGLSLGTKPTTSAAIAVLSVGVLFLLGRTARSQEGSVKAALPGVAAFAGAIALGGGAWYLRNLVAIGNPLPWFELDVGPLYLPSSETLISYSVAHYLNDFDLYTLVFTPGLRSALGTLWPVVLLLAGAGVLASIVASRTALVRLCGLTALAAGVAYLFTPNGAAGPEGFPVYFSAYVRYQVPWLALGLALLPLWPWLTARARQPWALAILFVLLLVTLRAAGFALSTPSRIGFTLVAGALLIPLAAGWFRRESLPRPALAAGVLAALGLAIGGGYALQQSYLDNRFAQGDLAFAKRFQGDRIAISGAFEQYHLYGADFSNRVRYLGVRGPHGKFNAIRSCAEWQRQLRESEPAFVVLTPVGLPPDGRRMAGVPERGWTLAVPGASSIVSLSNGTRAFRLPARAPSGRCRAES